MYYRICAVRVLASAYASLLTDQSSLGTLDSQEFKVYLARQQKN